MNATSLPADAPVERFRPPRRELWVGLGLGLATELFLDGTSFGLGYAIFAGVSFFAIAAQGGREGWQQAGAHRWVLLAAMLLLGSTMLTSATWLGVMSTLAAMVLGAVAIQGWTGETPLAALGTAALLSAPVKVAAQATSAGTRLTVERLRQTELRASIERHAPSVFRMGIIVVPPVLVLLGLLTSADRLFRDRVGAVFEMLFDFPLPSALRAVVVTGVASLVGVGVLVLTRRRRELAPTQGPGRVLKLTETLTLLGTLTTILLAFGLNSLPAEQYALDDALTYSEAANQGFFQLLTAAIGILLLLMALPARTKLASTAAQRAFKAFATALVLATLPMVVSAAQRLGSYEAIYGLTVLRLLAYVGMGLVSAVLVWRAITLWFAETTFVGGALAMFVLTMSGLAALGPDRFIAQRNLTRDQVDLAYLMTLSEEARLPMAQVVLDTTDPERRERVRDALTSEFSGASPTAQPFLQWNLGRRRGAIAWTLWDAAK